VTPRNTTPESSHESESPAPAPPTFSTPISIDPDRLRYVPFSRGAAVRLFKSRSADLDDFIQSTDVEDYEEDGFGKSYLVYFESDLVAYFTICNDGLRFEYLERVKGFSKVPVKVVGTIPSVKIGRLATDHRFERKGIARTIINYVAGLALHSSAAVRLIILESKEDSQGFYLRAGFSFARPIKRERGRRHRTMLLDLQELPPQ
jgi:GNAT superfamily N-acetyltransferase